MSKMAYVRFSNGSFSILHGVDHFSFSENDVRLFQNADGEGEQESAKRLVIAFPLHKVRGVSFVYDKTANAGDNFTVVLEAPKDHPENEGIKYDMGHRFTYDEHDNVIITRQCGDNRYQFQAVYNHMYIKNVVGTQWRQELLKKIEAGKVDNLPIMDKPEPKPQKPNEEHLNGIRVD